MIAGFLALLWYVTEQDLYGDGVGRGKSEHDADLIILPDSIQKSEVGASGAFLPLPAFVQIVRHLAVKRVYVQQIPVRDDIGYKVAGRIVREGKGSDDDVLCVFADESVLRDRKFVGVYGAARGDIGEGELGGKVGRDRREGNGRRRWRLILNVLSRFGLRLWPPVGSWRRKETE